MSLTSKMSMYPKMDTGQKSIFLGKFLRVNRFRILMPLYCKSQKGGVHDPNWFELVRSVGTRKVGLVKF